MKTDDLIALELKALLDCFRECRTAVDSFAQQNGLSMDARELAEGTVKRTDDDLFAHAIWELCDAERKITLLNSIAETPDFLILWLRAAHVSTILTAIGALPYMNTRAVGKA